MRAIIVAISGVALLLTSCWRRPEFPLEAASMRGDAGQIKQLLGAGADVNRTNRRGQTPIMHAARTGNLESVRILAAAGADLNLHDRQNGWTPLLHAVHTHRLESALLLIELGANVNAKARGGLTPLMMASGYGDTKMVQALLDKGADPALETADGDTALAGAVGGVPDIDKFTIGDCQTATVKALLAKAPDLKLKDNAVGRRARMFARIGKCDEVLAILN